MSDRKVLAAIEALKAQGVSDGIILSMVQAMLGVDPDPAPFVQPVVIRDEQAERRRAADRERKAKAKQNEDGIPRNSAEDPPSPNDTPTLPLTVENNLTPSPQPLPQKDPLRGSKKGFRLPPDWQPSAEDRAAARALGFSDGQAQREFDSFRDFWIAKPGKDGVKLDWPATLRNWLRKTAERRGIAPPEPGHGPPPEIVPTFKTPEEHQAWWAERRRKAAGISA